MGIMGRWEESEEDDKQTFQEMFEEFQRNCTESVKDSYKKDVYVNRKRNWIEKYNRSGKWDLSTRISKDLQNIKRITVGQSVCRRCGVDLGVTSIDKVYDPDDGRLYFRPSYEFVGRPSLIDEQAKDIKFRKDIMNLMKFFELREPIYNGISRTVCSGNSTDDIYCSTSCMLELPKKKNYVPDEIWHNMNQTKYCITEFKRFNKLF